MNDLKDMPVVTVEQVNRFRDAAIAATEQSSKEIERLNALVAMQAEALTMAIIDIDGSEWVDVAKKPSPHPHPQ